MKKPASEQQTCAHVARGELEAFATIRIEPLFADLGILGQREVRVICPLCLGYIAGIVMLNKARE